MTNKEEVRAWLYQLLARLEACEDVEAKLKDEPGNKVTIEIQFKS